MDVYSSIFGELTKEVQIRIDAATELRKRLFDQNIYERYLDWDVPTIGLNFEELIGQYNLSVAAATLDSKGKEPILGTEGLEIQDRQAYRRGEVIARCLTPQVRKGTEQIGGGATDRRQPEIGRPSEDEQEQPDQQGETCRPPEKQESRRR